MCICQFFQCTNKPIQKEPKKISSLLNNFNTNNIIHYTLKEFLQLKNIIRIESLYFTALQNHVPEVSTLESRTFRIKKKLK